MAPYIGTMVVGGLIAAALPLVWVLYVRWKLVPPLSLSFMYLLIFVASIVFFPTDFSRMGIGIWPGLWGGGGTLNAHLMNTFAFSPITLTDYTGAIKAFTAMFIHVNVLHVGGNMIFLILFGVPFERRVGARNFMIIYVLGGLASAYIVGGMDLLIHIQPYFSPYKFYVGSSAAIASIMGAYYMYYPRDEIYLPILIILTKAPVYLGVLIYIGFETALAFAFPRDGIGHFAHLSGILAGVLIAELMLLLGIVEHRDQIFTYGGGVGKRSKRTVDTEVLMRLSSGNYRLKEIAEKIEGEDNPDIVVPWLERFASLASCPECGGKGMNYQKGRMLCPKCGKKWRVY